MDIIELLVLLAFILFPLLQALLEKMGVGQRPEPPSPAGEAEDEAGEVAVERAPVRASADVPEEVRATVVADVEALQAELATAAPRAS